MILDSYPISYDEDDRGYYYEFTSIGVKKVLKTINYSKVNLHNDQHSQEYNRLIHSPFFNETSVQNWYSLSISDYSPEDECYTIDSITDNGDEDKVLSTITIATLHLLDVNPLANIFVEGVCIEGSCKGDRCKLGVCVVRNRKYRMWINKISSILDNEGIEVLGMLQRVDSSISFEHFETNKDYTGFVIRKKG